MRSPKQDLDLLSPEESTLGDPIPVFFRIELRKEFPHLRRTGPAQYPRAAVPLFYRRYGGLIWDGKQVEVNKKGDEGDPVLAQRGLVNGEIKLNQVLGANEVTIEINPANPLQVIAGSNNAGGQEMYYSADGGANWTIQGTLPDTCCDPTVDWKSDGSVAYTASLSEAIGVSFWRSFNGGQTWVDRVAITSSGSDKEFIHVDRSPSSAHQDNIYVTYHDGNTMQFARSVNDGTTFVITSFGTDPVGIGSDITTTSNGDIYYFYGATDAQAITLLKSSNGGDSFAAASTVASTTASFDWPIPAMETRRAWIYAAADADRSGGTSDGTVYVAWTDTTAADSETAANNHTIIQVARSSDGGATWNISNPHPMNDTATVDRFNQWIKVDEFGNVHVVYYDTQHSTSRTGVDLYYNYSIDGGVTWGSPQRISPETSSNLTDLQEWGDYNGLSVLSTQALPVWTDNRDGPPDSKDVYVADTLNEVAAPTFILSGDNLVQQVCKPASLAAINLVIEQVLGFTDPVTLSTSALPTGFSNSFTINPVIPPGVSVAQLSVDGTALAGNHVFDIQGSSGSENRDLSLAIEVFDAAPAAPTLTTPTDGATIGSITPVLVWNGVLQGADYTIEVDDDPAFGSVNFTANIADSTVTADPLSSQTTYYWRVRAGNSCGTGPWSTTFSFLTPQVICSSPAVAIPDGSGNVSDDLVSNSPGVIVDLNVSLDITHSYIGDLSVSLAHVDTATAVTLLDRPGVPASTFGCSADNISVQLDDSAASPAESQCATGPALGGIHSPTSLLSAFNGENIAGTWRLTVSDAVSADIGTLDNWCLVLNSAEEDIFEHGFED